MKKLRRWVEEQIGRPVSRNTLRTILTEAGLSWKKCKKLLANPITEDYKLKVTAQ